MSGWPGMNDWENPISEETESSGKTLYLSKDEWQKMGPERQARHFEQSEVRCHHIVMPGSGSMYYQALCGGVVVSMWHPSPALALAEAARVIAHFMQSIFIKNEPFKVKTNG